uniref:SPARC n=1 Tax=Equus asinus TaxID=9793 RepID=A0A8C4KZM9_EQUAS
MANRRWRLAQRPAYRLAQMCRAAGDPACRKEAGRPVFQLASARPRGRGAGPGRAGRRGRGLRPTGPEGRGLAGGGGASPRALSEEQPRQRSDPGKPSSLPPPPPQSCRSTSSPWTWPVKAALMRSLGSSTSWEEFSLTLTCPTRRFASTLSTAWTLCWRPWGKQERPFPTSAPSSKGLGPWPAGWTKAGRPSDCPEHTPPAACPPLRVPSTMRAWIFFLLCLAGRALAAPQQEALPDETEVVEETVAEVSEVPVGANPVQVEVGEFDEGAEEAEEEVVAENPCQNHHCKHGKVCELDENNSPMCVCQDPTSCPAPIGEFEKVCSNDNKTFDSSCHFFATKCTLEGTKKGHKLHLDYIGPCKYIPPCLDSELTEFPLRMRDWLKNVLVTLYERDEGNNLLTEKQKLRVKKIHENEKRLEAGDHPVELLARDFEKNYNMYLSHTELAPLRAPLIPMEHCTTRFFETCDLDHDKYIALDEWAGCFGIKEQDIDKDLVI